MFNKAWRLWRAKKSRNKLAICWNQRKIHNLLKSLKTDKNTRNSLQERALDVTDIARTQDDVIERLKELEDWLNTKLSPKLTHLMHIVDPQELDKDIQHCAANVIKNGKACHLNLIDY